MRTPSFGLLTLVTSSVFSVASGNQLSPFRTATLSTRGVRADVDICAEVSLRVLGVINIEACLCLSAVANLGYTPMIRDLIKERILESRADRNRCPCPDHARPVCSGGCSFECLPPFVRKGKKCVCPTGSMQSGDGCVRSPSSVPPRIRRARYLCPSGLTACGIFGRDAPGWDCIDIRSDLESCGGCTVPLPGAQASGTDCSAIHNIDAVSCVRGACHVHKCRSGYTVGQNNTSCIPSDLPAGSGFRSESKLMVDQHLSD